VNNLNNVILILMILPILGYYIYKYRQSFKGYQTLRAHQIRMTTNNLKTIALGLHQRFNNKRDQESKKYLNPNYTEDDKDFEYFVADIYCSLHGGSTYVVGGPGDQGVDIEHEKEDGIYLGQVKCYNPKTNFVDYDVIAILHSNMIKRGAVGGFVVTTSSYKQSAIEYAKGLNIELIDGVQLVKDWTNAWETKSLSYIQSQKPEYE
jgi:restriction system protein